MIKTVAPEPNTAAVHALIRPPSGFRQCYSPLSHVLATAIPIGRRADFIGLEKQHLRDAFVGVDLGGQWRGVGKLERDVAFPLGFQRRYVHDDAAIVDEDAGLQAEIACFRYGQTVDVVIAWKLAHGHDLVIAVAREAAEFLHNAGEAPEYRPVALKQLGGAPDGTGHV